MNKSQGRLLQTFFELTTVKLLNHHNGEAGTWKYLLLFFYLMMFYFSKTPVYTHTHAQTEHTAGENMKTDYITKMMDEINHLCARACVCTCITGDSLRIMILVSSWNEGNWSLTALIAPLCV